MTLFVTDGVVAFDLPSQKENFIFNNSSEKDKNGILMSSPIDFFGEMSIKVDGKTEM